MLFDGDYWEDARDLGAPTASEPEEFGECEDVVPPLGVCGSSGRRGVRIKPSHALKLVPSRLLSRVWGKVNSIPIPKRARAPLYRGYSWAFGVNLDEIRDPLNEYKTMQEFFTRSLKDGARLIDDHPHVLVSPCDGTATSMSTAASTEAMIEQVKGISYPVTGLLGLHESPALRPGHILHTIVLYLAPGDYHRFHSPTEWTVHERRHIPGQLLPVHKLAIKFVPELYTTNERVVLYGEWEHGFFSYTAVGATNVGSIKLDFDEDLRTNTTKLRMPRRSDVTTIKRSLSSGIGKGWAASRGIVSRTSGGLSSIVKRPIQFAKSYWYGSPSLAPVVAPAGCEPPLEPLEPTASAEECAEAVPDIWEDPDSAIPVARSPDTIVPQASPLQTSPSPLEECEDGGVVGVANGRGWVQEGYGPAYVYPTPVQLTRGELMGRFELGSTIVLVFEAPPTFVFSLPPNSHTKVRLGQAIGVNAVQEPHVNTSDEEEAQTRQSPSKSRALRKSSSYGEIWEQYLKHEPLTPTPKAVTPTGGSSRLDLAGMRPRASTNLSDAAGRDPLRYPGNIDDCAPDF